MEKKISYFEFQSARSVAKAIDPYIKKRDKLKEKIQALAEEYTKQQKSIDAFQQGIVENLGLTVEQLIKKEVTASSDKNGNTVYTTKYVPADGVTYDETTKQYVVSLDDEGKVIVPPSTAGQPGSDFDADMENAETAEAPAETVEEPQEEMPF